MNNVSGLYKNTKGAKAQEPDGKELNAIFTEAPMVIEKKVLELYLSEETKEFLRELLRGDTDCR